MGLLDLINERLDYLKSFKSPRHYQDTVFLARGWIAEWGENRQDELTKAEIVDYLVKRRKVSGETANKELRNLRAMFNLAIKNEWIEKNPTFGINFFPVENRLKYVPPATDIAMVLMAADRNEMDYLTVARETLARIGEVNALTWGDVNFERRFVVLYTKKSRNGNRKPRIIPMTMSLFEVLERRFKERDKDKPWVFWHRYWSRKAGRFAEGPYGQRKCLMKSLCQKAGVRHFGFHALRHAGASLMDDLGVPLRSVQKILGHSNSKTTELYLHSLGGAEREAMAAFENAIARKSLTFSHTNKKGVTD